MIEPKAVIHNDELTVDSSKTQVLHRISRICTNPKRYGFLISEQKDVLLIKNDKPTTYEESLISSESDKWLIAMKS